MVERRPFGELAREDLGWLVSRRHRPFVGERDHCAGVWTRMQEWSEEEIAPSAGLPLQARSNVEIVIYVSEGAVTHRDNLGNEGRIEAGSVQVVSAGTGIRHAEYNLEQTPARIFQIWFAPVSRGGSPAWAAQPCQPTAQLGSFVAIASGFGRDCDALPIRTGVRVLNAKLRVGESAAHVLGERRCAYLGPSSGIVDVNGSLIHARDGAAIENIDVVTVTAIEDADVVMVDVSS
jgi:redox-sensitive bicupin YhaK (pirin superfamily)